MRILIPRPAEQSEETRKKLEALGHRVVCIPLLKVFPPEDDYQSLDSALQKLAGFDWLIFTSQNAVKAFADRYRTLPLKTELPKVVGVGEQTEEAIRASGWKSFYTAKGTGEGYLVDFFAGIKKLEGQKILLPKSKIGLDRLESFLRGKKCLVTRVVAYQTLADDSQKDILKKELEQGFDAIFFYSPSQVEVFGSMLPTLPLKTNFYAKGETTQKAIEKKGWRVAGLIDFF